MPGAFPPKPKKNAALALAGWMAAQDILNTFSGRLADIVRAHLGLTLKPEFGKPRVS